MATVPITIEVDEEVARLYAEASTQDQKRIQLYLSLQLQDFITKPPRPLREVIDEMAAEAAAKGLTPEILESILRDEE